MPWSVDTEIMQAAVIGIVLPASQCKSACKKHARRDNAGMMNSDIDGRRAI
jgi:hypothetical protein